MVIVDDEIYQYNIENLYYPYTVKVLPLYGYNI